MTNVEKSKSDMMRRVILTKVYVLTIELQAACVQAQKLEGANVETVKAVFAMAERVHQAQDHIAAELKSLGWEVGASGEDAPDEPKPMQRIR